MLYVHTMEYYLAIKISEILIHATTWKNPENIMLSEISQIPKDIYIISFIIIVKIGKSIETAIRIVVTRY